MYEISQGKENFLKRKNRFLVIARVGDSSLHKEWLIPSKHKNFDLYLEYYGNGNNNFRSDCDYYGEAKDVKWPRMYQLMEDWKDRIFEYDAVWFPDDDISTDCFKINEMFHLFVDNNLSLAQPALTHDSHWSHYVTLLNDKAVLRYTNFVEVMAPIFSKEALQLLWTTFKKCRSGWGLDSVWPKILGYPHNKVAIIDKTPVKHTRPIGGGSLYKEINCSPEEERSKIEAEYGVTNAYDFKTYGVVWRKS
ncbi:hypothetical protein BKP35_13170 [Anaerobacillus arseniciselenatis]|uniref:DUF707 domain-containing protein n=1 Tax=Anaerobacillus arseniciselenatis TaxID=85682 RepID=A0A1S2LEM7_9BACI|nr:DUF707 domain-containing protein [Anaerobacillus arseniciselenatis]OIJ10774.1 hypothetical protein BKP35_13170 [Anaerobacillus arseniciselenatis]